MKKKVTYIISDIKRALAFEWIAAYLDKEKFELSFVLLNTEDSVLEQHLKEKNIKVSRIYCDGKKSWIPAWFKLYFYFKKNKPDMVHCHLRDACILGLPAAKFAGIPVRIYTRHHSSLHHVYFNKGVFWDRWINKLSIHIIAISGVVRKILVEWEKVPEKKITYIPHGFLLEEFEHVDTHVVSTLFKKYKLENSKPIVGVVSRFTEWKGIQYIIPAFKELLKIYPSAVLLLFNAGGDYEKEIRILLKSIPEANYRTIPFEANILAAYQLMDICVHTPVDEHSEAFGQVYIEALASGIPLVASCSGIGNDILVHKQNAWVVNYKDSNAITEGIKRVLSDTNLQQTLKQNGKETAKGFSLEKMINKLNHLYETA